MKTFTVYLTRTLQDKSGERIHSSISISLSAKDRDEAAHDAEKELPGWHVSSVAV